jgi:hypothetical protein
MASWDCLDAPGGCGKGRQAIFFPFMRPDSLPQTAKMLVYPTAIRERRRECRMLMDDGLNSGDMGRGDFCQQAVLFSR